MEIINDGIKELGVGRIVLYEVIFVFYFVWLVKFDLGRKGLDVLDEEVS